MAKKKGFFGKMGENASIESRYLEGKARGFKHAGEVMEQLQIYSVQKDEIKKLKKFSAFSYKEMKENAISHEKAGKAFLFHSEIEHQHPKLGRVYRMYGECRNHISEHTSNLVVSLQALVEDWKVISGSDIKAAESKLDATNKILVTRQYHESNRDYVQAKIHDEKYIHNVHELVSMIHALREKKEFLHPQFILRTLQAQHAYYGQLTKEIQMCEAAIRQLGPVDPNKFGGFHMVSKEYNLPAESQPKMNTNPYGSNPYDTGHQQTVTHVTTTQVSYQPQQPVPLPNMPRCRGLYQFNASSPQELSFNPGDVLNLISTEGQWWTAELNGKRGLVPFNYVERI